MKYLTLIAAKVPFLFYKTGLILIPVIATTALYYHYKFGMEHPSVHDIQYTVEERWYLDFIHEHRECDRLYNDDPQRIGIQVPEGMASYLGIDTTKDEIIELIKASVSASLCAELMNNPDMYLSFAEHVIGALPRHTRYILTEDLPLVNHIFEQILDSATRLRNLFDVNGTGNPQTGIVWGEDAWLIFKQFSNEILHGYERIYRSVQPDGSQSIIEHVVQDIPRTIEDMLTQLASFT